MNELLDEQPFSLTVNGRSLASFMMLPVSLKEFAYGYLVSEHITTADDIDSIMIDENTISVLTKNTQKILAPKKTVISGCGGTASYLDPEKLPKIETRAEFIPQKIEFVSPVIRAGGFGCALQKKAEIISCVYDLGQITALDKVLGAGIMKGEDLQNCAVSFSGKVTADMVRKCLYAGISIISAGCPPTKLADELAKSNGLKILFEKE